MTSEQKRIAIAEACGWVLVSNGKTPMWSWQNQAITHRLKWVANKDLASQGVLPDYLNDLNAIHKAEEILTTPEQQYNFISILYDIVNNFIPDEVDDYVPDYWEVSSVQVFPHLHATAAQRAEAFGLTLKLW